MREGGFGLPLIYERKVMTMKEKDLVEGLYLSERNNSIFDQYKIIIKVRETEKSYIFELVEYESRYSPAQIDMLFAKSKKVIIKKHRSGHAMRIWSNHCFTIYPFQSGKPFCFELLPDKADSVESIETTDKSTETLWEMAGVICDEVLHDNAHECQELIFCTIRTFAESKGCCPCCGAETITNKDYEKETCNGED